MKFQDLDGEWKSYRSSFSQDDKLQLEAFVGLHDVVCPMRELESYTGNDVVSIRHDVDHSLKYALRFAKWEQERDIRSSYYVLHTAYYYKDKKLLYAHIEQLIDMGHEVGLHTDVVSQNLMASYNGEVPNFSAAAEHLLIELAELRHVGFDVVGCAVHGGHKDFTDEELLKAFGVEFFNLEYEAYQLCRKLNANYISDNQGLWRAPMTKIAKKATIISTHPCHWPF